MPSPGLLVLHLGLAKPPDYSVLSRRVAALRSDTTTVRLLVLDSLLPRQRLSLQLGPPYSQMLSDARASGEPIAVIGVNQCTGRLLTRGVEARIESLSHFMASDGGFASHSTTWSTGFRAIDAALVGGRRCEVLLPQGVRWPPNERTFEARVRWLESEATMSVAACEALTDSLAPLVGEWVALAKETQRERSPGQLDAVLSDLGPLCEIQTADDVAFWIGALINPLPALGAAREIRAFLLEASSPALRVECVRRALEESIGRMREQPPGPIEVEPSTRRTF